MKPYLFALAAGLLVGLVYSLIGVRSPAPPTVALVGLLGILLGEQVLPIARCAIEGRSLTQLLRTRCADHVLGRLPSGEATDSPHS